jgi:dihydroflavonol-4-reductase
MPDQPAMQIEPDVSPRPSHVGAAWHAEPHPAHALEPIRVIPKSVAGGEKTLVTGASGFVGFAVARKLVENGHAVRVLIRPTSPKTHLAKLGVEFVEGDMRDPASVARAMASVRTLFHVAADYRLWAPRPADIIDTNVAGTRNLMQAAQRAGVERIVYTSSAATIALSPDGSPVDESTGLAADQAIGAYKRSKVLAERLVEEMVAEGLPAVIVNPTAPIGPYDVRPTPTGRIIIEAASGRMPCFVDTGLNFVHVDDIAAGHLAALERGRIGERYLIGGQNVALSELLAEIARQVGRRPPRIRVPRQAVMPLAYGAQAVARMTGIEPFVTVDGLRMAKSRMFFITAKAERELGLTPRPYAEGIEDAIRWFRDSGYLRR